jgi:hypothetical protein
MITAQYPSKIWDGSSPSRPGDFSLTRHPDFNDWDQVVAELIALQTELDNVRFLEAPNASGGALVVGQPVYLKADGTGYAAADANGASPLYDVIGLLAVGGASLATIKAQRAGTLTLLKSQWDTQTGETGGLTPLVEYYLSETVGKITKTRPATTGSHVKRVGIALNATDMLVEVRHLVIA